MAADDYDATINEAALNWNVDPRLLKAVMLQESKGDPAAVSKAGARGLMQIMPDTGKQLGMTDLHDPTQSIWAGAKYLAQALDAEKTPQDALRWYHGGPNWRQSYGHESQAYVPGVAKHYAALAPKDQPAAGSATVVASKQPDDAGAQKVTDDEFLKSTGATVPATKSAEKPQKATGTTSDDEFLKATGAAPASSKPQETAPSAAQAPSQSQQQTFTNDVGQTMVMDKETGAWVPEGTTATLPSMPSRQDVVNALSPAPDTTYGDLPWTWLAKDDKTGAIRFAMPNALRSPLLELFGGGQEGGPGVTTTVDPATGEMSTALSPLAGVLAGAGVNPLRFGGRMVTPGTPVQLPSLTGAIERATPETWRVVAPGEEYVPGRQYRMNQATGQREILEAGAAPQPNPLRGVPEPEAGAPQPQPPPTPAGREAVPGQQTQATGAQLTPSYEAIYTPAEEAAYRNMADGQKLLEHQVIGEPDNKSYIPGVSPNLAELEQTVVAARDMKELGIQSKQASEQAKIAAQRNNEARETYSLNTEKTPVDMHVREQTRKADIERQSKEVFAPDNIQGEVSMEPLISQMREEMNLPRNRENTALQAELGKLIKRLSNEDGTARTMSPEQAWGLRQDIDRMTDKHSTTGTDPESRNRRYVAGDLARVADNLDGQIETMAPGYKDMLATYKAHSQAIREMEILQGLTADLKKGPQGTMSFAAMQRFMKKVVDARATGPQDLNPYKSISEETMQRLWNLRDDLRRSAGALELARAAGSDTAQNIMDIVKSWAKLGAHSAVQGGAAYFFGPAGPIAVRMMQEAVGPAMAARRAARMERRAVGRMQQMLKPDVPLRTPPGQENPLSAPPP